MKRVIAIIAGSGSLPQIIANELKAKNKHFITIGIRENKSEGIHYDSIVSVGEIGKVFDILKNHKVQDVVFAGKIQRPSLTKLKVDAEGAKILSKFGLKFLSGGDDKLLSYVTQAFEDKGYKIIAPESIVEDLLTDRGPLTKCIPSETDMQDIALGVAVLGKLGVYDIGQAIVVENGNVVGIEALEGTDALIKRCGLIKKEGRDIGVLVKMKKSAQDSRIDLPAIGVDTVNAVHAAGLKGIAVEKGASIIIDVRAVVACADELGIFIFGV